MRSAKPSRVSPALLTRISTCPSAASASHDGSINSRFGTDASVAMSRTDWCECPGPPGTSPASDPTYTTFVFSVYITSSSFGATNRTSTALAVSTALAGLFVALLAPVLGQNSDRSGRTVRNLRMLTWALAVLSAALFVVWPEPAYLWVGLGLLAVGSVVSEIAGVNYNSTIDQVATSRTVGRVSGFGSGFFSASSFAST